MTWFRWLKNPFALLALLGLLVVVGGLAYFENWKTQRQSELIRRSEMKETVAGKVEFARAGSGPKVLVLHGAPGGYDQGLAIGQFLVEAGFEVLAPSRPGYLRTPLVSGILPEQQANLFAALLDELQISSIAVVAFGEGAASAVALASAYPDKVTHLVLLSPVLKTRTWKNILKENQLPGWQMNAELTGDVGAWALDQWVRWDPARALERTFEVSTTLKPFDQFSDAQDAMKLPKQRERFTEIARSFLPVSGRETGIRNDTVQCLQFPAVDFSKMALPLLVVRGEVDALTTPADAEISSKAGNRQQLIVERGGYFVMLGPSAEVALQQVVEFLKSTP